MIDGNLSRKFVSHHYFSLVIMNYNKIFLIGCFKSKLAKCEGIWSLIGPLLQYILQKNQILSLCCLRNACISICIQHGDCDNNPVK